MDPRVELFHYADLQSDLPGQLRRLSEVLEIEVPDDHLHQLASAATFSAMRDNADLVAPNSDIGIWENTTEFFHKGSNGQWQDTFDADSLRRYDERSAQLATPELLAWAHTGWLGRVAG
jgi:hypothetical protein